MQATIDTTVTPEMRKFIIDELRRQEAELGEERRYGVTAGRLKEPFVREFRGDPDSFDPDSFAEAIATLKQEQALCADTVYRVGQLLFTPEAFAERPPTDEVYIAHLRRRGPHNTGH